MKVDLYNSAELEEQKIVNDDDFFIAFQEPKEKFDYEEPKEKTNPEVKENEDNEIINKNFMDTKKVHLLSKIDKDNIADFFVTTTTNYIDDLANEFTGLEKKGRYMPSSESINEIKKSVSNLIPDKFRMPEWLKLVILIGFAYNPIRKKIKKDRIKE